MLFVFLLCCFFLGDPALLHVQIRDFGVEMDSIGKMNREELVDLCQKCGIHVGSNVSQV